MNCPICRVELVMSDRQGIEIDYCPQCRGIWLDRGELDKIIERSQTEYGGYEQRKPYHDEYRGYDHNREYDEKYRKRKRKSFLEDIFDFD